MASVILESGGEVSCVVRGETTGEGSPKIHIGTRSSTVLPVLWELWEEEETEWQRGSVGGGGESEGEPVPERTLQRGLGLLSARSGSVVVMGDCGEV